jgi:hypothetical protein
MAHAAGRALSRSGGGQVGSTSDASRSEDPNDGEYGVTGGSILVSGSLFWIC